MAFDNIDKARLVPDWAALGLAPTKPGAQPEAGKAEEASRCARKASSQEETTKSTNKPAADKPTRAE